ncbi:PIG-L family deacetylase [Paramicrobacterium chengjingii]|uniref:PIG-L family deacetylase n=2 Tax=Paramicrobacterium chengjingii TaxID=2769067 RepID=A0ABX6YNX7_9MICO|nr:PIG-L family deacetylase [Microbacterium chengjingii]
MAAQGGAATGANEVDGTRTRRGSVLDGVTHVLFVHAHPDDETLATGALLSELVDTGMAVTLVTCTRGERGEVVAGPHAHLEGTPEFAAHREGELAGALAELGVSRHVWLGTPPARAAHLDPRRYEDSGMRWIREGLAGPSDDASLAAFTSAGVDEEVADLLALIDADAALGTATSRPGFIVSYNEIGGYGHPDHVRAREVAQTAARARGIRIAEIFHENPDAAGQPGGSRDDAASSSTWFELGHRLDQVKRALAHHASQVTVDGDDVVHSGGQRTPIATSVGLRVTR